MASKRRTRIKEENEEVIVKNNGKRQAETHPPKRPKTRVLYTYILSYNIILKQCPDAIY